MMRFLAVTMLLWRTHLVRVLLTKRTAIVALGCGVPPLITWLVLTAPRHMPEPVAVFMFPSYILVLQMLVPLAAVVAGSGVISEEIDDRTITYLLTRPIHRATILIGRWLATATILIALVAASVTACKLVVETKAPTWKQGETITREWTNRAGEKRSRTIEHEFDEVLVQSTADGSLPDGMYAAVLTAALAGALAYSALFAALGTLNKHPLIVGLGYCFAIEGFLANLPGTSQSWTIQYYMRSYLLANNTELWKRIEEVQMLNLDPPGEALATLAAVLGVALLGGSIAISRRQYVLSA
jgi:hypothetical protein